MSVGAAEQLLTEFRRAAERPLLDFLVWDRTVHR